MSLFDVLKYQNTELSNRAELETLPEELISLYWDEAHSEHPESDLFPKYRHLEACRMLAQWTPAATQIDSYAHKVFMKALRKYNL